MKPQTPRTKNRFFFYWPISWRILRRIFFIKWPKRFTDGNHIFIDPTAVVTEFSLYGRQKKKFSDLAENGTNRLDDIKSGPNLVSDQKVDF